MRGSWRHETPQNRRGTKLRLRGPTAWSGNLWSRERKKADFGALGGGFLGEKNRLRFLREILRRSI